MSDSGICRSRRSAHRCCRRPWPYRSGSTDETAREIDRAVREIVKGAFERALAILTRHRRVLEESARELLQRETLAEPAVAAIAR